MGGLLVYQRRRRRKSGDHPYKLFALARGSLGAGWSARVNSEQIFQASRAYKVGLERTPPLPRSLDFGLELGSRPNFACQNDPFRKRGSLPRRDLLQSGVARICSVRSFFSFVPKEE